MHGAEDSLDRFGKNPKKSPGVLTHQRLYNVDENK